MILAIRARVDNETEALLRWKCQAAKRGTKEIKKPRALVSAFVLSFPSSASPPAAAVAARLSGAFRPSDLRLLMRCRDSAWRQPDRLSRGPARLWPSI